MTTRSTLMLDGRIDEFDASSTRLRLAGSQAFLVLAAAIRQLQAMHLMRAAMDDGGRNAAGESSPRRGRRSSSRAARRSSRPWRAGAASRCNGRWSGCRRRSCDPPAPRPGRADRPPGAAGLAVESARLGNG